jgi:hypothetical protein
MTEPQFTTEELEQEEWRPITELDDFYAVSNLGRVRRERPGKSTYIGRLIPYGLSNGYLMVNLFHNGKTKRRAVHRLVAIAFLGVPPSGKEVNHKDGNRQNAHLDNLEYVTRQENIIHSMEVLGSNRTHEWTLSQRLNQSKNISGANNPKAILTEDKVAEIRSELLSPFRKRGIFKLLAFEYNVSVCTIENIAYGKTWKPK